MKNSLRPFKMLIVDDDEDDFIIINRLINNIPDFHIEVDWEPSGQKALNHMLQGEYSIYMVDYFLGVQNGIQLLEEALALGCAEPIILLTGASRPDMDLEAIRRGAVDYLCKSHLNTVNLHRSIRYAIERNEAKNALLAKEKKFRNLFERSGDAIFIINENLNFIEWNKATLNMLGFTGKELHKLFLPDLLKESEGNERLRLAIKQGGTIDHLETDWKTKSGQTLIGLFSLIRQDEEDEPVYYQGILQDITHLKKMEKDSLHIHKLQSNARLARILAHEIRNPLTNINLAIDQLKYDIKDKPDLIQCLEIAEKNSMRINSLISELVESSRPRIITREEISLHDVLTTSLSNAIDRINLQKIQYNFTGTTSPALILGDAAKLQIAFLNIIINALEAMPPHDGQLDISLTDQKEDYKVSIADNGHGISEENLSKIFEPGFSSKSNGFGFGLAATLSILEAHKAFTDVESTPGKGTRFTFTFKKVP